MHWLIFKRRLDDLIREGKARQIRRQTESVIGIMNGISMSQQETFIATALLALLQYLSG
jgi:hypothetical protein